MTLPGEQSVSVNRLPLLPFGDVGAALDTDVRAFSDHMSQVITSLKTYDTLSPTEGFAAKTKVIHFQGLKVAASANTSVIVEVDDTRDMTLMIPFSGRNKSTYERTTLSWSVGEHACYLPAMGRGGQASTRSTLSLTFDPRRLLSTVGTMLGCGYSAPDHLQLGTPRVLPLHVGRVNFQAIFQRLCWLIDALDCDEQLLLLQGVDDLIYRNIALLMRPQLFQLEGLRRGADATGLDLICQYVVANLHQRITLSDLEQLSGMSARAMQYAFQSRFRCSPMQWVKQQRMAKARKRLESAREGDSVTQIALACGFSNLGLFAAEYKRQYGELPSVTLQYNKTPR